MSETGTHAANWYPDPAGRHELRYYDGAQWTDHVSSGGRQSVDPVTPAAVPVNTTAVGKVQQQVAKAGVQAGATTGGGTIFSEPVLVVNQKAKLIEVNNEYAIYDQHGRQLGAIRQVGQSAAKKVAAGALERRPVHDAQPADRRHERRRAAHDHATAARC